MARPEPIQKVWACVRIVLGWIFFWAFIDKLWGLGFSTAADKAWLDGVSPTTGFLKFAAKGPFVDLFHALAGSGFVDWLFMLGLLGIGLALLLGIGVRIAGYAGVVLMLLMYLAVLPSEHNPLVDEHIVYALVLLGLAIVPAGETWGLGRWWRATALVKRYPALA